MRGVNTFEASSTGVVNKSDFEKPVSVDTLKIYGRCTVCMTCRERLCCGACYSEASHLFEEFACFRFAVGSLYGGSLNSGMVSHTLFTTG